MCAAECAVRFEPICASMGFVDTSAERFRAVFGGGQAIEESGERGRNRTYNLLIKSYGSQFDCGVTNCSRHNNLTIKRPAWTASENVEKVGEIEPRLTAKDTKRTQSNLS